MAVKGALPYATLVGSLAMQAPQIYKILKAKSAAGITALGWASASVACAAWLGTRPQPLSHTAAA